MENQDSLITISETVLANNNNNNSNYYYFWEEKVSSIYIEKQNKPLRIPFAVLEQKHLRAAPESMQ